MDNKNNNSNIFGINIIVDAMETTCSSAAAGFLGPANIFLSLYCLLSQYIRPCYIGCRRDLWFEQNVSAQLNLWLWGFGKSSRYHLRHPNT